MRWRTTLALGVGLALACAAEQTEPTAPGERVLGVATASVYALSQTCVSTGPETCYNAHDDNCNGLIDEGCGVETGLIQFSIAWGEALVDVDLDVVDPDGHLVEVGRVAESGLTKLQDCPGRNHECGGRNMENVFLEPDEELRVGTYLVKIRLEKLVDAETPIRVRFGARLGSKSYAAEFELEEENDERELKLVL